jgi:uncharacterized membrane protein
MNLFFIIGLVVFRLLVLAAIGVGIFKIVKYVQRNKNRALNLLKERYVKGEIDEKEYRDRLSVLTSST